MPKCDQCDRRPANPKNLKTHNRDYHVDVVYYGESLTPINKNEKGFTCPICHKIYTITRTIFAHLKKHDLNASFANKKEFDELASSSDKLDSNAEYSIDETEADEGTDQHSVNIEESDKGTDQHSVDIEETDEVAGQHSVDIEETGDEKTYTGRITQIPLEVSSRKKISLLTHRDVILTSTNSLTADEDIQEDKMMLAKLGRWAPIIYRQENMQYGMLTSPSIASILLSKSQTTGSWCSPSNDVDRSPKEVMKTDSNYFIRYLKITSKASKKLVDTLHEEITGKMVDVLNRDWLQHPQMRYCTPQLLAGAILIEGATGIVINAVEPYSRDTLLDAHYERRFLGAATSFPSKPNQYGFLSICQLSTPDGLKLIIGSRTSNFLVTSSLRLDSISVNLGPATTHFTPSENTRLFLDVSSIAACKSEMSNPMLSRSQLMPSMYLLRQVRSKFDHLSTYTLCRSVSMIASQLELQPSTIWTLSDQESSQTSISQEKVGSLLFREIAIQVIKNEEKAVLKLETLLKLTTKTKKCSTVDTILSKIRKLFEDQDQIAIIGNTSLNNQLTDLAAIIRNKRENDKKIELISKALYD
ncbi:hypothetical protein BD408DRAFT_155953 [Parasitella parasitica]|nr:hypothetical protein BD408DRAFT_155953 [Parasitella parasitica]